jgi:DNA-binding NtrC family response regulator
MYCCQGQSSQKSGGMSGEKTKVLLVEDDRLLSRTVAELLVGWGYQVETAADGVDALKKFVSFEPLVVISDLHTPRVPAPELVEVIHYSAPDVNCIIMTDSFDCPEATDAVKRGASALTRKPPDADQLRNQLENCLHHGPPR